MTDTDNKATIINAVEGNSTTEYVIRTGVHVGLWLIVIAFQCVMGFNASNFLDGCVLRPASAAAHGRALDVYGAAAAHGRALDALDLNGTAPNGTAPNGTAANGTAPNDTAPNDTAPNDTAPNDTDVYGARLSHTGPSETTVNIGITGATFTLIGVALVLAVGGMVANSDMQDMLGPRTMGILMFLIQFFTTFGMVCGFYIFSQAAQDPDHCSGYTTSVFGVAFMLLAQLVLYANIACFNKSSLPRNLLPAAVLSVQIVSYFAIVSQDFAPEATESQKLAALLSPLSTALALIMLMVLRMPGQMSMNPQSNKLLQSEYSRADNTKETVQQPLRRALVMFVFTVTGMLSVYKLSFVASYPDSTSYLFALSDAVLTLLTLTVMFVTGTGNE